MLNGTSSGDASHVVAGQERYSGWRAAVELGGAGWGAAALAALAELSRPVGRTADDVVASLAHSTAGSLYRQAGRHADALIFDGRALAAAAATRRPDPAARWAMGDALVNLAADNLGLARFGASRRLLARAAAVLGGDVATPADPWEGVARCRLRLWWVRTELALYTGDAPTAVLCADRAVRLLDARPDGGTPRHRVKTELIAAAARAATMPDAATAAARRARRSAHDLGLIPLEWAAVSLQLGLGDDRADRGDLERLTDCLADRGMPLPDRSDAPGRR
ncbi:MAG: hypothetical protein QM662_00810 [Gordonia sp. (in: high G+C Gram-positive bacteria)]